MSSKTVIFKNNVWIRSLLIILILFSIILLFLFVILSKIKLVASIIILISIIVSLKDLKWGIYLFVFSLPFFYLPFLFGNNISVAEAILFAIFAVYCFKNIKTKKIRMKRTEFDLPIFIFFMLTFLTTVKVYLFPAANISLLFSYRILLITFEFLLVFFLVINVLKRKDIDKALFVLFGSILISVIYALIKFFLSEELRISAFFDHPNLFAMFLIMLIPLAIYKLKKLSWILPLLLTSALILTFSRGALIGLIVSLIFYTFFSKSSLKLKRVFISLLLSILVILFISLILLESSYSEKEIVVNSSQWQQYNFTAKGENTLKVFFTNDYYNDTTKEDRNLFIANITNTLSKPIIVNDDADCSKQCILFTEIYVQADINGNFSVWMKADYARGWPVAFISLEKHTPIGKLIKSVSTERFSRTDNSFKRRLNIWRESIGNIKKKPILGNGYIALDNGRIDHAHNFYLQLWMERGIFILIIFFWITYLLFRDLKKYSALVLALNLGIVAFLIHGLTDYSLKIGLLLFLFIAIIQIEKNDKNT